MHVITSLFNLATMYILATRARGSIGLRIAEIVGVGVAGSARVGACTAWVRRASPADGLAYLG
jgi:hypothetical protein